MPGSGRAAVFSDVEGTLVDASLPRISLQVGRGMGLFSTAKMAEFTAINLASRLLPAKQRRRARFLIIQRAMAGRTKQEVQRLADGMLPEITKKLKRDNWLRVQAHRDAGLPLVLISAGVHEVVERLGKELGGRGEGTKFTMRAGVYTSHFDGPICEGEGKAQRAIEVLRQLDCDPALSYAYGDTGSDIPFLALFGHPCAVDPDETLRAEATRRGWEIFSHGSDNTVARQGAEL